MDSQQHARGPATLKKGRADLVSATTRHEFVWRSPRLLAELSPFIGQLAYEETLAQDRPFCPHAAAAKDGGAIKDGGVEDADIKGAAKPEDEPSRPTSKRDVEAPLSLMLQQVADDLDKNAASQDEAKRVQLKHMGAAFRQAAAWEQKL